MKSGVARVRRLVLRMLLACRRALRVNWRLFGLNPPLRESEVIAFEQRLSIALPADYRDFITHIGNGGDGAFFRLGELRGKPWHEGDDFVGVLSKPFPHRKAWNDRSAEPSSDLYKTDPHEAVRQRIAFEKAYFAASWVNGAFPIWDEGSGALVWLVVTGEKAGHLWQDDRYCGGGIYPLTLKNGEPATFSSWYEWLVNPLTLPRRSNSRVS